MCTCASVHLSECDHLSGYLCARKCVCVCLQVSVCALKCVCVCLQVSVCARKCVRVCLQASVCAYMHADDLVHVQYVSVYVCLFMSECACVCRQTRFISESFNSIQFNFIYIAP